MDMIEALASTNFFPKFYFAQVILKLFKNRLEMLKETTETLKRKCVPVGDEDVGKTCRLHLLLLRMSFRATACQQFIWALKKLR